VNPETPPLPNEAKEDLVGSAYAEVENLAPPPEPAEPSTPAAPKPAQAKARPAPPPSAGPGTPMPAMPDASAEDDFDDEEIPDQEELEAQMLALRGGSGAKEGPRQGIVVTVRHDGAFVDIGEKSEAFLPFPSSKSAERPEIEPGQTIDVVVSGTSPEGYLLLAGLEAQRPGQWRDLELAYGAAATIVGKVTGTVKGGLSVDVGARAFLPGSRSGERDQASLEALVGQEIRCRIVQLDIDDRNVVLDRRAVIEEERAGQRQEALAGLQPGAVVRGVVRNLRDFGAFVDIGGIDALLHVSDLSWERVKDVASVLKEGDELEVKVLKVDPEGRRISVGRKQLEPDPWTTIGEILEVGSRIRGHVTRLKDFGAFVEVVPGVEGLIHVSEMAWNRRVRRPHDVVSEGEEVDAVVLELNLASRRIALGLKQALGDPWERAEADLAVGSTVEGTVQNLAKFGAFVEVLDGVEGLLHISDISAEKRLSHPSEALRAGQKVRVKVLELDREKRRLKLGMKQLEPSEQEAFLESAKPGDAVTGRVLRLRSGEADVEIGEGVVGVCVLEEARPETEPTAAESGTDSNVSSLGAMLQAAWKGGEGGPGADGDLTVGQVRSFRITDIDAGKGAIRLAQA